MDAGRTDEAQSDTHLVISTHDDAREGGREKCNQW